MNKEEKITIQVTCVWCESKHKITITKEQYKELQTHRGGRNIQDILPDHSPEERELLISGICPKCWDDLFKEHENDFDE